MEPHSHSSFSSVHPHGWDDGISIHWRGRSWHFQWNLNFSFFLFFFLLSLFIYFLFFLLPQFSFYTVTKYTTLFPGHIGFLIWRKEPSSLLESQETLGIRLLNTSKLIIHLSMVSQYDKWFFCKFHMRSHILLPR